ncbi:carboxymuconolactone decarboxylase family protein [Novosphingobium soli]|uniref:Carboxymuconolactone decarboxylase family protein n=1 Tax=Novosphingobium soli TaxID=574956 RepID=A0ABV6D0D8_9SPHN
MDTFDIAAREAHVVGEGPRIAALPEEEIDEASRRLILEVRAGAGAPPMVEVPEYMRTVVKHPEIFRCQMEMGAVLFRGRIAPRERELAVLRVAWLCRAPYEWGQHVAIARRAGLAADEIARVRAGSAAPGWSVLDAAILRGVEELIEDRALSDATWDALAQCWDEAQLIEFPMMVGQYVATAYLQNSLRIPLEPGNRGLAQA